MPQFEPEKHLPGGVDSKIGRVDEPFDRYMNHLQKIAGRGRPAKTTATSKPAKSSTTLTRLANLFLKSLGRLDVKAAISFAPAAGSADPSQSNIDPSARLGDDVVTESSSIAEGVSIGFRSSLIRCHLCAHCRVGFDCHLEQVEAESRVVIGDGCRLAYVRLHAGASLGTNVQMEGGRGDAARIEIGSRCAIGDNTRIAEGVLIFPGAVLGKNVCLRKGTRVGLGVVVPDGFISEPAQYIGRTPAVMAAWKTVTRVADTAVAPPRGH